MTNNLPPLPKVGPICYASASDVSEYKPAPEVGKHLPGVRDVALWTTHQMQSYARAAIAAQPVQVDQELVYQYQLANGSWIDQAKESYDYNIKMGQANVRVLCAAIAQPVQPPSDRATVAMKSMPDPAWKGDVDEATYKAGWNDCCAAIRQGGDT